MDDKQHMTALEAAECRGTLVAEASSERRNSEAWTVLSIWHMAEHRAGELFVAIIKGESRRPGEVPRDKRKAFPTLAQALGWSEFDHSSKLYDQLRKRAIDWMDRQVSAVTGRPVERAEPPAEFVGLGHAICWLYEGHYEKGTTLLGDVINMFVRDFPMVPRVTVEFFIDREQGRLKEHVEPNAMTEGLVKGLIHAIRFIDRRAFHAAR